MSTISTRSDRTSVPAWHLLPEHAVLAELGTRPEGLSAEEAAYRLASFGPNKLPESQPDTLAVIFLRQFQSPLIYILMGAAAIVYLLGDLADAAVVCFVLLFNAVTGTIQEGRAQSTLSALKKFAGTAATALRGGKEHILPDELLVPGDVFIVQEGEKIPADARLLESNSLQINEASLTGESAPIAKASAALAEKDLVVADRSNMLFKGTYALSGSGRAVVVATGLQTELGRIAKEISQIDTDIPLKRDVDRLSRMIMLAVIGISAALMVLGVAAGKPLREIFSTVVSLAVSVIPEGLPIVLTLILAKGVWDMSRRNVLVKRLQAVEALGQTKIIAVDKTGTLTKNEMVVKKAYVSGTMHEVSGLGYEPEGQIAPPGSSSLTLLAKLAALSSGARLSWDEQQQAWKVAGDPTEAALLVFAAKAGQIKEQLEAENPKILEIPFDYRTKYHCVINGSADRQTLTVVGAAEKILELASSVQSDEGPLPLDQAAMSNIQQAMDGLAGLGLRVVAAGFASGSGDFGHWQSGRQLTLAGLFGIQDALRAEVQPAMNAVKAAGMKVAMITGDHKLTAQAIAAQAGIFQEGDRVVSGDEINSLKESELVKLVPQVAAFVRVTPEHKLKIVQAYKKSGLIVAMTGDGVNDAPSLVAADLGVAMGKIGTEVAKEAADIVLLDDNFGSIVAAVEEGRNIYRTIKKALKFLFSTALAEVLTISSALIVGLFTALPLPLLPAQILWINLVGSGILGIFLAYEPKEPGLLAGQFKKAGRYIIDLPTVKRMAPISVIMAAGTLLIFLTNQQADYRKALTLSFTAMAMFQWLNAWNCKSETLSLFSRRTFRNRAMTWTTLLVVSLQLLAIYAPPLQKIFDTVPLGLRDWLTIMPVAASIIAAEELIKLRLRRKAG